MKIKIVDHERIAVQDEADIYFEAGITVTAPAFIVDHSGTPWWVDPAQQYIGRVSIRKRRVE